MVTRLGAARWACLVAVLAGAGCGGDLFHGTDWTTACDTNKTVKGCKGPGAGGASSSNPTSSGAGGGGAGAGGAPPDGSSADRAGPSCGKLLDEGYSHGSGVYWIDPGGGGPTQAFDVYCDMMDGWTLVAVVSGEDAANWSDPTNWNNATTFGPSSSNDFKMDMKNLAYVALPMTELKLENATAGVKTVTANYTSAAELFGIATLVTLMGMESGWTYSTTNDMNFFAQIQNPPATGGVNLSQRNGCVLAMGYDSYNPGTGPDDEVQGFGCIGGLGGGSGACFMASCLDVVRDADLRIYVR